MFKFTCHWNKGILCDRGLMCRGCEHQPEDDDKPNGKKPPVKLRWIPSYDSTVDKIIPEGEPQGPACGQMPYSTERCIFCGQKFLKEDT